MLDIDEISILGGSFGWSPICRRMAYDLDPALEIGDKPVANCLPCRGKQKEKSCRVSEEAWSEKDRPGYYGEKAVEGLPVG